MVRSSTSITVVDQSSYLFPDVPRNRVQARNSEPLQCLGRSPAMIIIKAHSAVIVEPILWNIREKLERLFGILELDTQMLQQCQL